MKNIVFENLSKSYDQKTSVLDNLNLQIDEGERVILLGPSGCGKSTILRIIGGLESITSGKLIMGGQVVNDIPAGQRNVSMVFQNYALYPHMTVEDNICYGLKIRKVPESEMQQRLDDVLEILSLKGLEKRKPRELSGGQRQRVALARAIVKNADYFLLDEPLSNLDAQLRLQARQELVKLHERYQMTFVYVTHDQIEAMTMGQKIVLLNQGKIQMVAKPKEIYHHPANIFTARFIGSPAMNIIPVKYTEGLFRIKSDRRSFIPDARLKKLADESDSSEFFFGIRPEEIKIAKRPTDTTVEVAINYSEDYGHQLGLFFDLGGQEYVLLDREYHGMQGDRLSIEIPMDKALLFDMKSEMNLEAIS